MRDERRLYFSVAVVVQSACRPQITTLKFNKAAETLSVIIYIEGDNLMLKYRKWLSGHWRTMLPKESNDKIKEKHFWQRLAPVFFVQKMFCSFVVSQSGNLHFDIK